MNMRSIFPAFVLVALVALALAVAKVAAILPDSL